MDFEVFTAFENCCRGLRALKINEETVSFERFKNKFSDHAYSYCQNYNFNNLKNLSDNELKGLKELKKDRSIIICKADKGNCVVLLKKAEYVNEIESLLSDTDKFRELDQDPTIKRENKLIHTF